MNDSKPPNAEQVPAEAAKKPQDHQSEMLCIRLNPDQAILLHTFGINCTRPRLRPSPSETCLTLANFGIAPHSIHIMPYHIDDICDIFQQLDIIPPFQQNRTFYQMKRKRDEDSARFEHNLAYERGPESV